MTDDEQGKVEHLDVHRLIKSRPDRLGYGDAPEDTPEMIRGPRTGPEGDASVIALVEFLRARSNEEEQAAQAATPGPWRWEIGDGKFDGEERPVDDPVADGWGHSGPDLVAGEERDLADVISSTGYDADNVVVKRADAEHIARHDPARVLRDVEAKRQIIAAYESAVLDDQRDPARGRATAAVRDALAETVRLLALPDADHPDFREEWAP